MWEFVMVILGLLVYGLKINAQQKEAMKLLQDNFLSHLEKMDFTPEQKLEALKSWDIHV